MDSIVKDDEKSNESVNRLLEIVDKSEWFNSIKSQKSKRIAKEQIEHLLRAAYSNGCANGIEEALVSLGKPIRKRKKDMKEND